MANELDLVVTGGMVVNSGAVISADVVIDREKIVGVVDPRLSPPAKKTVNAAGKYVLPGIVDPECHLGVVRILEDDVRTETRAAAVSGVTTWGMQLSTTNVRKTLTSFTRPEDIPSWMDVMEVLKEVGDQHSMTDYYLTAKIMNDTHAAEVPELVKHGVTSFKTQLHLKTGAAVWGAWDSGRMQGWFGFDDGTVYLAMRNIARIGPPGIYSLHCENWEIARILEKDLIQQGRKDVGAWDDRSPAFCEAGHVRAYAYYARVTGCPLYVQHVTTPETVQEILKAKEEGVTIFGQTGSHYLSLPKDTWKINVPLRSRETIEMMWEALAAGHIDSVGSDHVNYNKSREQMEVKGNLWESQSGFSSRVEALLPIMLSEGVNKGRITLPKLVEVCCQNPARIFGLYPKKGAVAVGSDADLVLVDLERTERVSNDMIHSSAGWSIYEDWEIKGWPVMTILRGQVSMEWPEGEPKARIVGEPNGRYLHRSLIAE